MTEFPNPPDDFEDVRRLCARFGSDPMHIQGAGGNGSIKDGDVMWIKASGTLMGTALDRNIFVATDLGKMRVALERGDPIADQPASFTLGTASQLRPSIETSLHAVFEQRIVLHTHCVNTLAYAVQQAAVEQLAKRLTAFNWSFVKYAKPGANLARSVRASLRSETNVVVLGNHGLIVAGDTAGEVAKLQSRVHAALAQPALSNGAPNLSRLEHLAENTPFRVPDELILHQLALDPQRVNQVSRGSLYPDHVIFCGIAVPVLLEQEELSDMILRIEKTGAPTPLWALVPGAGVVVRKDAKQPALVMMRCLAEVMARVPLAARLTYLTAEEDAELLNWDAEKYRQSLNT